MRRKLWMIDLTLLVLVILFASMLKARQDDARKREESLLRQMVPVAPAPAVPAMPGVQPSVAASYMEVAQKFLFSRDRNPDVILDPPPPPPAPPPPKPVPELPVAYGVMDLGAGPTVVLAPKSGGAHRGYRIGEQIGEFKVAAIDNQQITFEWEGKQITRKLEELIDKKASAPPPPEAPGAGAAPAAPAAVTGLTNIKPVEAGPGVELSADSRACVPGDATPAGTIKDGYRKTVNRTPFGNSCRWEAVR